MKLVRYTDSPTLRDALSFFGVAWGLNKQVRLSGLIDVLIKMFLDGEINTDKVFKHYRDRQERIVKAETERLLKHRFKRGIDNSIQ